MHVRLGAISSALLVLSLSFSFAFSAHAAKAHAQLLYDRGDLTACPDEADVRNAVSARLGYDPFDAESTTVVATAISREAGGLRARVEVRDSAAGTRGVRELTSAKGDCSELASAMELAISIAIHPQTLLGPPVGVAALPALPPPAPKQEPEAASAEPVAPIAPVQKPVAATRVIIGAAAALGYGAAPGASPGVMVFAGMRRAHFSLRIEGRFSAATAADAPAEGSVTGAVEGASLTPCGHLGIFLGCVTALVGNFHGAGRGVDVPIEDNALFAAAGARVGAEIPISSLFFVGAYAETLVPFTREHLRLRSVDVWDTSPVTVAALVGLGTSF